MPDAFSTAHLDMSETGRLYLKALPNAYLLDMLELGFVGCPTWPAELGQEPEWFDGELWQCLEWHEVEQSLRETPPVSDRSIVRWLCGV